MRRGALLWVAPALTLIAPAPAPAFWPGFGTGSGQAPVALLAGGNQPAVAVAGSTVTVSWSQASFQGAPLGSYAGGGYTVERHPAAGGASASAGGTCAGTVDGPDPTLSCEDTGVPPGSWRYSVTPVLGSWSGAQSAQSAAAEVATSAPALTAASAQNPPPGEATGGIALSWDAVAGATGYEVFRRTSGGSFDFSAPLNGTALTGTAFSDPGSGLTGGTTYHYVVVALVDGVRSAPSAERSATAITRPAAPTGVTATPMPDGDVGVAWSGAAGADGFNVYRRAVGGTYDFSSPLNGSTPLSGMSYLDATSADGVSYEYRVRAVVIGAGGVQVESFDGTDTPPALADATPPTGVVLTDPGSPLRGSVALSATASDTGAGVASVRFQTSPAGASTWTDRCTGTTSPYTCTMSTLALPDGLYDLRVIAADPAGNTTASEAVAARRVDNTAPVATVEDPGAFIRGTVTLSVTATETGSGLASVTIQRSPTGANTWTTVCTGTASPTSCPLNTTTLAEGGYDLRALASDVAGNSSVSALLVNRVVDNTAPTGVDVQTTNAPGGTAAKPERGDVITWTFSEPMLPGSLLLNWAGEAIPVTVRFTNGNPDVATIWDGANAVQVALGSTNLGKKYVTANTTFFASSMVQSGNSVAVTLGTPSGPTMTANGATTLRWITSTAATDRAGNPMTAGTIFETGVLADPDF